MGFKPLITSVGIEIESAHVPKSLLRPLSTHTGWRLVEDGSVRDYSNWLGHIPASSGGVRVKTGGELVSPILNTEKNKMRDDITFILRNLYNLGEGIDLRNSVHIHINCTGLPLYAVKNLYSIGAHLECALYRLACAEMGFHRGEKHLDHGFARPITGAGPVVTLTNNGQERPTFTFDTIMATNSLPELQMALGRHDRHNGSKYHEARYVWLNLIPLFTTGTVEFRLWNMTLVPSNILAWVEICAAMVRLSFGKSGILDQNPLGTSQIILDDVIELLQLDNWITYILERLWNQADYPPPIAGYQRGHLNYTTNWRNTPKSILPPIITNTDTIYPFEHFRNPIPKLVCGSI